MYNTRSKVNHVTAFKNTPQMFKKYMTDTSKTHIVSDYIDHTYPKNITTGKILGYRYLVKMDAPVWTNYMCNKLGRLSRGWKSHTGTDTIEFIFPRDNPKGIRATYVRVVCDIQPQKIETHRTRLTEGGNMIDYPGEVSTPTSYLTTIKLHVNSAISDVKLIYMCMDIKYFYLNNQMNRGKYIMIQI